MLRYRAFANVNIVSHHDRFPPSWNDLRQDHGIEGLDLDQTIWTSKLIIFGEKMHFYACIRALANESASKDQKPPSPFGYTAKLPFGSRMTILHFIFTGAPDLSVNMQTTKDSVSPRILESNNGFTSQHNRRLHTYLALGRSLHLGNANSVTCGLSVSFVNRLYNFWASGFDECFSVARVNKPMPTLKTLL
jgi:hypothetical protein